MNSFNPEEEAVVEPEVPKAVVESEDEDEDCEIELEEYFCDKIRYYVDRVTNIVYNDDCEEVGTINVLPEDI